MFATRRLAKRSIVGTRVCAPRQDGRFYPGVISTQLIDSDRPSSSMFIVHFTDGYRRQTRGSEIIGPGFQSVSNFKLNPGQKVFVTLHGREVAGTVTQHHMHFDEVMIAVRGVTINGDSDVEIVKRVDDVRLMESRKSARLQDQDTDYSRLADVHVEPKRRAVSHVIDVPTKVSRHRYSSLSESPDGSAGTGIMKSASFGEDVMSEHVAALVLTSLSSSPVSPKFPASFSSEKDWGSVSHIGLDGRLSSSLNSSGFLSTPSDTSNPSPPLAMSHFSESAPGTPSGSYLSMARRSSPGQHDDGIDLEENIRQYLDAEEGTEKNILLPDKSEESTHTMYKCTWPSCERIFSTQLVVEKHVRTAHLRVDEDSSDLSEGEEEFYYTEIEMTIDNVTQTFSDMFTSSPQRELVIAETPPPPTEMDHDYQKKDSYSPPVQAQTPSPAPAFSPVTQPTTQQDHHQYASSVPTPGGSFFLANQMSSTPIPIDIPQITRSLSWQNTAISPGLNVSPISFRAIRPSPQERLYQHQAQSPKTHSSFITSITSKSPSSHHHKRSRSDIRKCRKVYGMENRDLWCTQCKWKKACSRFTD